MKEYYDHGHRDVEFNANSLVWQYGYFCILTTNALLLVNFATNLHQNIIGPFQFCAKLGNWPIN